MTGKHSSVQRRQTLKAYGFMTPALIIIILFTIIPIIGSLVLMFYDYSVLGQTKFVGLKNFVKAFHDRVFWISIKNSVIFVVVVPIIQILSILLAVLVNKKLPKCALKFLSEIFMFLKLSNIFLFKSNSFTSSQYFL